MARHSLINWVANFSNAAADPGWTITNTSSGDRFYQWQETTPFYPTKIEKEFDRVLSDLWLKQSEPIIKDDSKLPKTNVFETEKGLQFESFIPFAKKEEVKVTLDPLSNGLKIEVESHQPEEEREYHLNEISRTSFKRSFAIDKRFDVKKVSANFENGILTLFVPYAEEAEKIVLDL